VTHHCQNPDCDHIAAWSVFDAAHREWVPVCESCRARDYPDAPYRPLGGVTVRFTWPAEISIIGHVADDGTVTIVSSAVTPDQYRDISPEYVDAGNAADTSAGDRACEQFVRWADENNWPDPMPLSADDGMAHPDW
jgi:hypothetical protein